HGRGPSEGQGRSLDHRPRIPTGSAAVDPKKPGRGRWRHLSLVARSSELEAILCATARIWNSVPAEAVGVVAGGEVGGQLAELGADDRADGLYEILALVLRDARQGWGRHGWTPVPAPGFPRRSPLSLLCTLARKIDPGHRPGPLSTEAALVRSSVLLTADR